MLLKSLLLAAGLGVITLPKSVLVAAHQFYADLPASVHRKQNPVMDVSTEQRAEHRQSLDNSQELVNNKLSELEPVHSQSNYAYFLDNPQY